MKAEILTIGDELLIGQVLNTNAAWIGEQLGLAGAEVSRVVTVGDDDATLQRELRQAVREVDLVIATGGLGPTHDDVTKKAVAAFFDAELHFDPEVYRTQVEERFARRGRTPAESNRTQAMIPEGFEVLPNPRGTAPGLWHVGEVDRREVMVAVLPGVPHEMRGLMEEEVLPRVRRRRDLHAIAHRTLLTTGIGESDLQERIGAASDLLDSSLRLAYLPGTTGVRLRLSAYGDDVAAVENKLDRLEQRLRQRIGRYIYGMDGDELPGVVGRMLRERGLTIGLAESCTGGHVVNLLTDIPGASSYVLGGVTAYCNSVKVNLLGVDEEVLEREGAVCEEVALQMAHGARRCLDTDIGVSTTGIAGPTGGTPDKPVGTVWIAYADADGATSRLLRLTDQRVLNKELTAAAVLDLVRRQLE